MRSNKISAIAVAALALIVLGGCQPWQKASVGDMEIQGPASLNNQAVYEVGEDRIYRINTSGNPYAIEYGSEYGLIVQGNGPVRFVGATLPGGVNVTIASETDYGWESAKGEFDPETETFSFEITGFTSNASAVAEQAAASLALRIPAWQSLSSDQKEALVRSTETLVSGGVSVFEATAEVAELFLTGGASAILDGDE